jgi:hypothetical protein
VSAGDQSAGAASVEHVGLCFLLVAAIALALGALAAKPADDSARELGSAIAERIACAPRHPVPCHRNPLALAYGFPVGKLVRLLAPRPRPASGPGGVALLPVDFRYCRRPSCALPGSDPGLTASNRRATAFTAVEDRRRDGDGIEISYWLYRPGLGWELRRRLAGERELATAQGLRLNLEHDPALVPLELLAGRNHYDFPAGEEPPWRWRVESG